MMQDAGKKESMDKKTFVENLLSPMMAEAYPYIKRVEWDDAEEIATIVCNNDYCYHVNCVMDSKSGIVTDVTKEANRH